MKNIEIIKYIKTEFIKSNIIRNLIVAIIVPLLSLGFSYLMSLSSFDIEEPAFSKFSELVRQNYLMFFTVFLPLLMFVFIYTAFSNEYKNRTKRILHSYPIKKHYVFYSKIFVVCFYIFISLLIFNSGIYFTKDFFFEIAQKNINIGLSDILMMVEFIFGFTFVLLPTIITLSILYDFSKSIVLSAIGYIVVMLISIFIKYINSMGYDWLNVFINHFHYLISISKSEYYLEADVRIMHQNPSFLFIFSILISVGLLVGSKYLLEKYDRVY